MSVTRVAPSIVPSISGRQSAMIGVDLEPGAQRFALRLGGALVQRLEIGGDALEVALERVDIGVDEADRVVQLVRDAGDEAAEARHLLLLDEPVLRLLQLDMRLVQRLIGAPQFADRPPGEHGADAAPVGVELRRAIAAPDIPRRSRGLEAQLGFACAALAPGIDAVRRQPLAIGLRHEGVEPRADQFALGPADQARRRRR